MNNQQRILYRFGPFKLDKGEHLLLRDNRPIKLKPKDLALLIVLVENTGHLLSREELMKQVWTESFVEENNLAVSICKLRKVLGEGRDHHPYIETVARRGYRFVAAVTETIGEVLDPSAAATTVDRDSFHGYGGAEKGTMAILPFKSIGRGCDEHLNLGMADALITRLGNLRRVIVRPTSSVRNYNLAQDPLIAGRKLGVEWVLDGSVQKSGKRLRVTVQLVRASGGGLLWAETFDEEFTNIFAVEDSISEQVAKALTSKLSRIEKQRLSKRYTENVEAHQAYLKGRYFFDKRTITACLKAIDFFNEAVQLDPNYALAYAGMADCHEFLHSYTPHGSPEHRLKCEKAVLRALELDEELAEAHATLGHIRTRQWDWTAAENAYKKAIQLTPNYATAHAWYAVYLRLQGRLDEAFVQNKKALEIDPLSLPINASRGLLLYLGGQYDEAIKQLLHTLELDANFPAAHYYLGVTYEATASYKQALRHFRQALKILGRDNVELRAGVARIHALSGRQDHAIATIDELRILSKERFVQPYSVALVYAALPDVGEAFRWLEKGYAVRDEDLALLKVDPRLNGLRDDPRFESLLRRVGLAGAPRNN